MGKDSVAGLFPSVNRAYLLPLPRRQGYPFSSVTYKLQKLLFTLLPNISPVLLRVQKLLQDFLLFKWINGYIPYEI